MLTYKPESRLTSSDVVKEFRDIWVRLLRKYKECEKHLIIVDWYFVRQNSQQKEMEKTLFNLCTEPNPSLIKIKNLVNQGISVNCLNEDEMTPLLQLLANGEAYRHDDFVEIIHFFVEKKIDLNAKNEYGENALLKLIVNYKKDDLIDLIKLFVDNEININCKNKYGTNILHYVCEYYTHENLMDIIQLLIEQKVEINCIHDYGHNALPVLCRNYGYENLYDIIKLLIENGIEVHCNPNNEGNALNIIINHYREENRANIVELLSKEEIRQRGRTQAGSSSKAMKRKHN
jgi:ankyrin repeat protein